MYLKYLSLRFYPLCSFQFFTRLAAVFAEGLDLNIDVELQRGPLPELIA